MLQATRRFEFSAAHRYWRGDWSAEENERTFGKCASPYGHGHNYTLDVTVSGQLDERTGMVMNMTELKAIVGEVLEEFDHRHLNEDTPYFRDQLPTTENIVRLLWRLIAARLPAQAHLSHLRLYEMSDLWADYDGGDETTFARAYTFAAAHRLHAPALSDEENRQIYGKCNNPNGHGHNYTLEVSVAGPVAPDTGMVVDLVQMDAAVRAVLDSLDFHHIDREVPAFADRPSTAENIVAYLWGELAPGLGGGLRHLRLWETRKNVFEMGVEGGV
jgi:6-pyruvoyltetrahydropterin/6-carboxytetrahydropterin synthase